MRIRMQLIRAGLAVAIIGGVATAETFSPAATEVDCPLAKVAKPQRILLLDPIQKHPTWIDARSDLPGSSGYDRTIDAKHGAAMRGVVAS
ncbi:MAG TPA: hypothetical protein VJ696_02570 [Rhodanobacteraceae bacterium]|nr:hypothetical protein [Rhodanobacteraceae bacterium]